MSSTYTANKVLELIAGKTAFATPTVTLRLSKADPLADGSGISQLSGSGYAGVVLSGSDWESASGGEITNAVPIDFPEATDTWDEATHFYATDASGNLLWRGPLAEPVIVGAGEILRFPAGTLVGKTGALAT